MFIRMFNVMLPWSDSSNGKLGKPEFYESLDWGPFTNTIKRNLSTPDHYYSRYVSADTNADSMDAMIPDDLRRVTYKFRNRGALLSLPNGGHSEDVIRTNPFEDYIQDHIVSWFTWAQKYELGVERMEDLILVTGCTLVTSWAVAVFVPVDNNQEAEISLASNMLSNGGTDFIWSKIQGTVAHRHSHFNAQNPPTAGRQNPPSAGEQDPTTGDQCVFIRGFRAKRVLFRWTKPIRAEAEPRPDDPDNRRDREIQATRVPGVHEYNDPLVGILDYIAEKCLLDDTQAEETIAIAHDDDLQLFEDVETLTVDTVRKFLLEKQIPLLVEKGAALLRDPRDIEPPVSDEKKATFYATAELNGEPVPVVIHPALTKYNLKLDMSNSVDEDYDLPKEELTSSAVYPPMLSLKLESQSYPHTINIEVSNEGVTVQDVLRTIHEDLRTPLSKRELSNLRGERGSTVRIAFRERCKSEDERGKGPHRIDYLGGRDRLQVLPKLTPDGTLLPINTSQAAESSSQSKVAGPSRIPA